MKYLIPLLACMATPALADKFENVIPDRVCWYNDIAYGIGSHNPNVSAQYRGAAEANQNTGYGQFCVIRNDEPTWVYMDYDHTQERWVEMSIPLFGE